jgi:hypothetical protein
MDPSNATARFLAGPGDRKALRIELWEADFLLPTTFNAVIFGSGRVEVQSIEYQVEHRFKFQITAEEVDRLIAAITSADPLSCPPPEAPPGAPDAPSHPPPTRIVLVNATGERWSFTFPDSPPEAAAKCRRLIAEIADPFRRKLEPAWSRGPYVGMHPFPSDPAQDNTADLRTSMASSRRGADSVRMAIWIILGIGLGWTAIRWPKSRSAWLSLSFAQFSLVTALAMARRWRLSNWLSAFGGVVLILYAFLLILMGTCDVGGLGVSLPWGIVLVAFGAWNLVEVVRRESRGV